MTATSIDSRDVLTVGANHRSSLMTVRDRLFVEDADISSMHEKLQARGIFQAFVLSTCDRTEVTVVHQSGDDTATRIIEALAEHADMSVAELANQLYILTSIDAVDHIFRVVSSLDSLVVGEPQILGQVKAAHRLSRTCGAVGPDLEIL
jgi:glutamyl-tRNA reductase